MGKKGIKSVEKSIKKLLPRKMYMADTSQKILRVTSENLNQFIVFIVL